MSLLSQLFSGNRLLLAAATSAQNHITPGSSGPHVAKIQEALNLLESARLAVDAQFGPKTAEAVVAFKTKHNIVNTSGRIDNIVGVKTLAALDTKLKTIQDSGSGGAVVIDPFLFTATKPMVLTSITTDLQKSDLDNHNPPIPPLNLMEKLALLEVRFDSLAVLELRMKGELFLMAQGLGLEMFERFKRNLNRAERIPFPSNSTLGSAVSSGTNLASVHDKIRLELDALLKQQFSNGRVNINSLQATAVGKMQGNRDTLTNPNGIQSEPIVSINITNTALLAVIGGSFGGGVVSVTSFTADQSAYDATLRYELIDHFGVDNSDVIADGFHGTPGQKAFWMLQHQHKPGYNPFITTVVFEFPISGRWAFRK